MAFTQTRDHRGVFGRKRIAYGTYTMTAVTTGELETGLELVETIHFTPVAAAIQAAGEVVLDETLPLSGPLTIVGISGATGHWFAIGR